MTDYDREVETTLFTMRNLAKANNSTEAKKALTKLASRYNKFFIADMLEQYGVPVPLKATKPILVDRLVYMIVTEAVIDKSWERWFFKTLAAINA